MTLNTNFDVDPYFNDHDASKNYYGILFKASTAVQAREVNQLQTILQEQVERFGENILKEGTIVKGGNFVDHSNTPYVKISDNNTSGQPIIIGNYAGARITGRNSGVTAIVIHQTPGLESQAPDLNTLYIRYTSSGSDAMGRDIKTFIAGEVLEFTIGGILQPELTVTVASFGVDPNPLGNGYLVSCGDGIIFQKGYFVRFTNQMTVVSKYDTEPDRLVVGFDTEEIIVSANADPSLFDNAAGYNNHNAPGADRLKLLPKLVTYTLEQAEADDHFFTIQEYQNGNLIRRNVKTQYNEIAAMIEQRTAEESGDYIVSGFNTSVGEDKSDAQKLNVYVSRGLGYVAGKRVETVGEISIPLAKGEETGSVSQQNILANYGNYIIVESVVGSFNINVFDKVNLYGATQSATSLVGFAPTGSKIGEARVVAFTRDSGTRYRLYLFDIKMTSTEPFASAKSVVLVSSGFGNIVLEAGKAVLKDASFSKMLFPIGKTSIKEVVPAETDYVARRYQEVPVSSSGVFTITLAGNETFPYGSGATLNSDALRELTISNTTTGLQYNATSASVGPSGNTLTVNIGSLGSDALVKVTFNVKISNVLPIGKNLATVYMRINPTGNLNGPYHLGWPDVVSIEGVWKGTDLSFTEATAGIQDVTNNFKLVQNTRDTHYDISYIQKNNINIVATDRFLVKAKVYVKTVTGGYSQSFFTINSYPIDDVSETLPANKIRTENVPAELRNSIDFRPYAQARAVYATSPSGASVWTVGAPLSSLSFGTSPLNIIAPNQSVETTYSYYLGRKDRLILDRDGQFLLITGSPSETPSLPAAPSSGMTVATINVPAFPTLTMAKANRLRVPQYGASASAVENRSYTMRDIEAIDKRVESLEYYTVLNMLEKSAEDLVVKDGNGLNRFKNGIVVDDYSNLMLCDTASDDFKASVDRAESTIGPRIRSYEIPMKIASTENVVVGPNDVAMLRYNDELLANWPAVSKYRNCVTDFYSYAGTSVIHPEYDGGYDTTYAPDVTIDIDMTSAFADFTKNLNEIVPLKVTDVKSTSKTQSTTSTTSGNGGTTSTTVTTTNSTTTKNTSALKMKNVKEVQQVGDFITDIQFSPYLRGRVIRVATSGLRPNTTFYVFFDGKSIARYIASGRLAPNEEVKKMVRTTAWGTAIKSDNVGDLNFLINLPGETFYTGDRDILIIDIADLNSREAATSASTVTYRGFNFSVEKTGLEVSTRTPDFNVEKSKSVINSVKKTTDVSFTPNPAPPPRTNIFRGGGEGRGDSDPIAQTFMISKGMSNDTVMYVSQIEVAFFKKSLRNGVTLELRTTDNGYPASKTLPFGRVRLTPSQVQVSANGSLYTNFRFKVPVALATGNEYAVVIIPDGNDPDYLLWVSKTGETDKRTGTKIVQDTNSGTLFTSTNNRAWTPYQDENMALRIRRARFLSRTGAVNMVNSDLEFFNLASYSGKFQRGETVYVRKTSRLAGTVSTTAGSNVVTGSGTAFNTNFAVGRYIAIRNQITGAYEVSKIAEINGATSMVLEEDMKVTQTGRWYHRTSAGTMDYFNTLNPVQMFLDDSSAIAGDVFAVGDILVGENSKAVAEIGEIVDLPISYIQPNIYRTTHPKTSVSMTYNRHTNTAGSTANTGINIPFNESTYLTTRPTVIMSRTNEVLNSAGGKSMGFRFNMASTVNENGKIDNTPTLDVEISSITAFQYFINAAGTQEIIDSEKFDGGLADSRVLSKKIGLADGMDAEDFRLWLTAYKPGGTGIEVYVKFQAHEDSTPWGEMPWTKLSLVDNKNFTSSNANRFDYKEYEYVIPTGVKANGQGAYLTANGDFEYKSADGVTYTNFKTFAIKETLGSTSHNHVPRIKDMRGIALA